MYGWAASAAYSGAQSEGEAVTCGSLSSGPTTHCVPAGSIAAGVVDGAGGSVTAGGGGVGATVAGTVVSGGGVGAGVVGGAVLGATVVEVVVEVDAVAAEVDGATEVSEDVSSSGCRLQPMTSASMHAAMSGLMSRSCHAGSFATDQNQVVRLFVAAWPPAAVVDAIASLPRPASDDVRFVEGAHLHVTLRFIGDTDARVDDVSRRLALAPLPHAVARLGPVTVRFGEGVLAIPVAGLDDLAGAVRGATSDLGEAGSRPFRGHLTIARARRARSSRSLAALTGLPIAAEFAVGEIALVASDLSATGPTYSTIAMFPTRRSEQRTLRTRGTRG